MFLYVRKAVGFIGYRNVFLRIFFFLRRGGLIVVDVDVRLYVFLGMNLYYFGLF